MRLQKLTALALVAAAMGLAACNDKNSPLTTVIVSPTTPPVVVTPPVVPAVVTAGSFTSDQVAKATCSNNFSVDVNSVTFTDSDTAVDVESLTPGCAGGPAT